MRLKLGHELEKVTFYSDTTDEILAARLSDLVNVIYLAIWKCCEHHVCMDQNGVYCEAIARKNLSFALYSFELLIRDRFICGQLAESDCKSLLRFCQTALD